MAWESDQSPDSYWVHEKIVTAGPDDLTVEFSIDYVTFLAGYTGLLGCTSCKNDIPPALIPLYTLLIAPSTHNNNRHGSSHSTRSAIAPKRLRDIPGMSPGLKDLTNGMFNEVPRGGFYDHDPSGRYERVRDYQHMLELFNEVLDLPPKWDEKSSKAGMVGAPFNAILAWPMATPSGHAFFLNKNVNSALQRVRHEWGRYLLQEESADAVDSWLTDSPDTPDAETFEQLYVCDSSQPHFGFRSWDAFFVRGLCDGVRPVATPDDGGPVLFPSVDDVDPKAVIVSPCESVTYWRSTAVQARDTFRLKGQPYSLLEMLDYDALAPRFLQGTVHQSWIEAEAYHRWHAPVAGRIVKTIHVPRAFFAQLPSQGFPDPDPMGQNFSLRYLTAVATRCLVFIEADNSDIGLMCFIAVVMMEISSCEITVQPDQHVAKGEQIGMFHCGGSSHCLVFQPGVNLEWIKEASPPFCGDYCPVPKVIPVRSSLACVRKEVDEDLDGYVLVDRPEVRCMQTTILLPVW